ncbi:MAG: ABC transporter ATP-binding protein [Ardenticatenaceae bacterium]|nr:ABC transporter ATP-binding protein [Ardenticatenaceae bacterium]HBY97609.1 ABC transporter ATP-binding protein [Chloroflexota bacterium]
MRIEIDDLVKVYRGGVRALQGVDLHVESGMFGLLGPNGAGKTTLLRILATLLQPTSGRVLVDGFDVSDQRQRWAVKRLLGYLPQELGLYPNLSAYEFLDYIATLKQLHHTRTRHRDVERVLALTGLEGVAGRRICTLSGGMKRRVGIAQALLGDPKLLIVDEPTVGLDPEERVRFRTLLARLAGERVVILSTHIVEDIATTSYDMAVMKQGRILFHGSPTDLLCVAEGETWRLTLPPGHQPDPEWRVATSVRDARGLNLRIIGPCPSADAEPVPPTLEEAYIALMQSTQTLQLAE